MAAGEPVVQIRLARDSAALGFVAAKWVTGDSVVYISQESTLSDDGIEHVGVFPTREGLVLCFSLTAAGGARLQQVTEQAIGRHAAMLITARVVSMARIMSGIGALRRFTAGVNAPRNVADELAARIIAKWPQRLNEPNCTNSVVPPPPSRSFHRPPQRRVSQQWPT